MTSIPVRKGTTVNRRSGILKENKDNSSHTDTDKRKHISKDTKQNPKLLTRRGSKKELEDENVRLHEEIQAVERELLNLESTLSNTQEQLVKSREDSAKVKNTCERTLLTCNIDPVTLEKTAINSEDENELSQRRNHAKVRVSVLQEKLQDLNTQASSCIKSLNGISTELDNLSSITSISEDNGIPSGETTVT